MRAQRSLQRRGGPAVLLSRLSRLLPVLHPLGPPAVGMSGDAAAPPTGEGRFDALLARHLVWTLPDPEAALRQWVSRLRPGGTLVLVEGRWCQAGQAVQPYAAGAEGLPWVRGVSAAELAAVLRPRVRELRVEELSGETDLWGGPVGDERFALVARV